LFYYGAVVGALLHREPLAERFAALASASLLQQYDGNWSYDSDQLIIQIVCAPGNEAEPVPGTYRVSEGNEVGTVMAGTYYGTFGIGSFFQHYEAGSIASAGAAVDGSMTLEKNADGTWTIDFDFLDGQAEPKHFSGSWTGTLG
jgi:hypothetical protein